MKLLLLLLLLLLPGLAGTPALAQGLYNAGATLTVGAGATLSVAGGATNASGGTLVQAGALRVAGGLVNAGTLDLSTGTTTLLSGDLLSPGAVLPGTGTLEFAGPAADQTLSGSGLTLYNLVQNNTGPAGQNRLLLPASLAVTHQVQLLAGLVRTAPSATLNLPDGATLAGEAPGRYVQGNLRISRAAVAGPVDFGHGAALDGTGQSLGAVSILRTAGLLTAGLSFGQNLAGTAQGIDRLWTVSSAAAPSAPVPLTLSWLPDDDHGLATFAQTQLWQQPAAGLPWAAAGAPGNAAGRSLTRPVAAFGRFTLSNAANPLPVELVSFTAERRGPDALLRWATASERDNAYFAVESSADGRAFGPLGQVAGHGSSAQPHAYEFRDPDLARYAAEVVYYRLRQVDRDGTATLSPVRPVRVPAPAGLALDAYPSPLGSGAPLRLRLRTAEAGPATLLITDALGRQVLRQPLALGVGTTALDLPAAGQWPTGLYLLRLEQHGQQRTARLVRE